MKLLNEQIKIHLACCNHLAIRIYETVRAVSTIMNNGFLIAIKKLAEPQTRESNEKKVSKAMKSTNFTELDLN